MTRLDRSIQGFTAAVALILFNVLPAVIFLGIAATIMFRLDWRLALLVLAFAPVPAFIAAHAGAEQSQRERTLLDRWARIYARFNEVLSGIVIVRSFSMEDAEKRRFLKDVAAANEVVIRGVATDLEYASASNLVIAVARLSGLALGGYLVVEGAITVGTLVAFLGYIGGLFGPVQGLGGVYSSLRKASVSLDEIFGILNVQEHLRDSADAADIADVKGAVDFENVHFGYEQPARPLLNGITLHVAAGETIAIVGPSGAGKTTLIALLMRFYDPLQGRIAIDGRDLRGIKQSSLRQHIGVVLQDTLLFNDTVRANIAYGRPEASNEEIEAAAQAANAHEFIKRLPEGYATLVGERGSLLSSGERQRITIARALLKNSAILILDEATSGARRRVGGRRTERARIPHCRANDLRNRPSPLHRRERRSHYRAQGRPHHRNRHACTAAAPERLLRLAGAQAALRHDRERCGRSGHRRRLNFSAPLLPRSALRAPQGRIARRLQLEASGTCFVRARCRWTVGRSLEQRVWNLEN